MTKPRPKLTTAVRTAPSRGREPGQSPSSAGAASIDTLLTGGDPRTLGNVDTVVNLVVNEPSRLDELIAVVLRSADDIVRMRSGDALEKVCRADPPMLRPHVQVLLGEMSQIDQPSVRWHVAQMLGVVRLTPQQRTKAARILCNNLDHSSDWIVQNHSLDSLAILARRDDTLVGPLRERLRRHEHNAHRSVAKRATKLLAEFG